MMENWEKIILYLLQLPLNLLDLSVEREISTCIPFDPIQVADLQENFGHKPGDIEIQQLESY